MFESRSNELLRPPSGSSFYAAMRVLPPRQRNAMFAVYGFCRAVDDIADKPGDRDTKLAELSRWRSRIDALFGGVASRSVEALVEPVRTFDLQRDDFLSIIDGMEMDVVADIDAPDIAALDLYCDRVACAVGRLCVRVFGMREPAGSRLAHHLGRALQLTNILRDLDEDAQQKRLYLPREMLLAAGIAATDPMAVLTHSRLHEACTDLADVARVHFTQAIQLMSAEPLRIVRAPMLMAKVYQHILEQLIARGWTAPRRRIRVPKSVVVWNVLRYGLV
ncbi:MAG TPA: presqualene diphosphate synthase HpnD [Casimicrobiaceae bacterium]|jgi:phytoene synthase